MLHVKEWTLDCGDMQFDCIRFGAGARPLVMIQGLNTRGIRGAGLGLAWMYRSFVREYTVYLFDRRAQIHEGITVRDMAADLARCMEAVGIRSADVFGVSQGGMIAQYLAIDYPALVRRMVLAVTLSRNNKTVTRVVEGWIDLASCADMKGLVADMAQRMYSKAYLRRYRPLLPLLTLLQKPRDVERFAILARACLTCNAYAELDRIRCPVLVLGGREDQVVTAAASEEIAGKLGCGLLLYEGLGHAAYEEARDFNKVVLDFLKGGEKR